MKFKKSTKKNIVVTAIVIALILFGCFYVEKNILNIPDMLSYVLFVIVTTLLTEDVYDKVKHDKEFKRNPKDDDRYLLNWQYLIMGMGIISTNLLWLFFSRSVTYSQMAVRTIPLIIVLLFTIGWAHFIYRVSVMSEEERFLHEKIVSYKKCVRKIKEKTPDAEVRTILHQVLFCRLAKDKLQGALILKEPFTTDLSTYDELSKLGDDSATVCTVINGYIDKVISNRHSKSVKEK